MLAKPTSESEILRDILVMVAYSIDSSQGRVEANYNVDSSSLESRHASGMISGRTGVVYSNWVHTKIAHERRLSEISAWRINRPLIFPSHLEYIEQHRSRDQIK
jgi:hypothetical protein